MYSDKNLLEGILLKIKYNTPFTMIENKIIRDKALTIYQKMVFIALCSYANENNICFPSYQTIADAVGCSRRKVIDTIKELVNLNLIAKHTDSDTKSNTYEIITGEYDAPTDERNAPIDGESHSLPSAYPAPKQYTNNNIKSFNNNHLSISESEELETILENSGIDGLYEKCDKDLFKQAITSMYQSKEITVCGNTYPQSIVRKNMQKLTYEVVAYAFDILKAAEYPPKSPINYLISVLYRGIFEVGVLCE